MYLLCRKQKTSGHVYSITLTQLQYHCIYLLYMVVLYQNIHLKKHTHIYIKIIVSSSLEFIFYFVFILNPKGKPDKYQIPICIKFH